MKNLSTAAGNVVLPVRRITTCCICGCSSRHDVCNNCMTTTPDGETDWDAVEELIAADLREERRERIAA